MTKLKYEIAMKIALFHTAVFVLIVSNGIIVSIVCILFSISVVNNNKTWQLYIGNQSTLLTPQNHCNKANQGV